MERNNQGFTLIEIVVVLVLVSIIAATVFTRSITTDELNIISQAEIIKGHFRYAQSLAMKRNQKWGIFNSGNEYWLFGPWETILDELNPAPLPGQENDKVSLTDLNLDMSPQFVIFFDGLGKPIRLNPFEQPLVADFQFKIENLPDRSQLQTINITAETGLITAP